MRPDRLMTCTVDLARAAVEGVDVMPDALALLDHHVGAETLSVSQLELAEADRYDAEVVVRGAEPMRPDELVLWPVLMADHPYLPRLAGGPLTTSRVTDVVDLADLERTELYQRLLGPRRSRYQAALLLERSPRSMVLLSLWRFERDFDDEEVERLEAFRTVMAAATSFARAVDAVLRCPAGPAVSEPESASVGGTGRRALTRRQRQVAVLVEGGLTNDQIARRLGITSRTVRKHVEDLFEVTGARTRTQVALWWRAGARGT